MKASIKNAELGDENPPSIAVGHPSERDLQLALRVIAMARIGLLPSLKETREAIDRLKNFRLAIRQNRQSDMDLERPQAVLQKMSFGYLPEQHDCIISVQSLTARIAENKLEFGRNRAISSEVI